MADTPRQPPRPKADKRQAGSRARIARGKKKAEPAPAAPPVETDAEVEELDGDIDPEKEPLEDAALDEEPEDGGDEDAGATHAIVPATPRALAPAKADQTDLLQRYMSEVSRYPLLSREDELALARRYRDTQDPRLAYRLVTANLRLVVKIAWEYRRAAFNLLDLIQEGNVGLMQGVKKYDPERGVKLSSYAAWWIRAYIIRYLMDNWRLVKLGTTQAQRKIFFNLRKEKEKLAKAGFEPEAKLLAERLNVSEQDVVEMDRRLSSDDFSLDQPIADDSSQTYVDRLEHAGRAVDDALADEQIGRVFREKLDEFSEALKDKERFIYERRLIADEPLTLQQVGDHYGISRERARQIEARLVSRLKAYMQENLPDYAHLSLEAKPE